MFVPQLAPGAALSPTSSTTGPEAACAPDAAQHASFIELLLVQLGLVLGAPHAGYATNPVPAEAGGSELAGAEPADAASPDDALDSVAAKATGSDGADEPALDPDSATEDSPGQETDPSAVVDAAAAAIWARLGPRPEHVGELVWRGPGTPGELRGWLQRLVDPAHDQLVATPPLPCSAPESDGAAPEALLAKLIARLGEDSADAPAYGHGLTRAALAALGAADVSDGLQEPAPPRASASEAPDSAARAALGPSLRAATGAETAPADPARVSGPNAGPVRLEHLTDSVVRSIRYVEHRGAQTVTIRLAPASLGEVHIDVTQRLDALEVRIASANPAVRELLENQLQSLRHGLQSDNGELARVSIAPNLASGGESGGPTARQGAFLTDARPSFGTTAHAAANASSVSIQTAARAGRHDGNLNVYI